jgi:hypothetical protein
LKVGARRRHCGRAADRDTGKQTHTSAGEIASMTHHSILPDCYNFMGLTEYKIDMTA